MSENSTIAPVFITDVEVKSVLSWPMVNSAVEEALKSVNNKNEDNSTYCNQPARSFTPATDKGVLLSMPGFVGNYILNGERTSSLGCKLVTSFRGNCDRNPKVPNVLGNILLFDNETGQMEAIIDGTEITAWRTASASLVATKYLFPIPDDECQSKLINLAIIGCGVQGIYHSLGFCSTFNVSIITLWNRTHSRALELAELMERNKKNFRNPNIKISVVDNVRDCVKSADVVVTGTYTRTPLIHLDMLQKRVHINAVGAGEDHHSELAEDVYENSAVFIDNWANAKNELKDLKANIIGEVGDVINLKKIVPNNGITIFQSMGMAAEDIIVAQAVYNAVKQKRNDSK